MTDGWYELAVQLAAILVGLIGGVATVPFVNWLKGVLKINGRYVQILVAVVSVIVAILTLVAQGQLAPETITQENLSAVFLAVLVAGQAEYNRIKQGTVK